jgi:penicillin-binding protein 1B
MLSPKVYAFIVKRAIVRKFLLITLFLLSSALLVIVVHAGVLVRSHLTAMEQQLRSSHQWEIPSSVFADSPIIHSGMPITQEWLVRYLQALDYTRMKLTPVKDAQYSIQENAIAFRRRSLSANEKVEDPVRVTFDSKGVSKVIDLFTKQELQAYELEPIEITRLFASQYETRSLIRFEDVPRHLVNAVIAIEDRRFYDHGGIDFRCILRALKEDIFGKGRLQGASTITQQLVKNFYLTSEKSFKRKLNEATMAILLERKLTKNQILELYLNEVYLGQRGPISINGVSEASRFYFHKDVRNIDVPEAALLAGMLQAPRRYSPYLYMERARERRNRVLLCMKNAGNISTQQYEKFVNTPIVVQPDNGKIGKASYFVDLLGGQLAAKYSPDDLHRRDFRIFTTLDFGMQQAAEESVADGLTKIDKIRFKKVGKQAQACLIAIEPSTGFVRAFVGGRNYSVSQFDRLTQALRQPGSSFKPFVYAAALESFFQGRSEMYSPATLVSDEPWSLPLTHAVWQPKNYDGRYHGVVSLRNALANSMNIATARLAEEVGLEKIASLSRTLGFQHIQPYPSLALGAFEASPWQLIQAYSVFANGGNKIELSTIKKITNAEGKVLVQNHPRSAIVLHPQTAYIITDMLKSVIASGTGISVRHWGFAQAMAGKTGTTNDFRDAWFIGYTPDLITLVWVGYDDNTSLNMNGAQAALPIWAAFMKKAIKNLPIRDFAVPSGVVTRSIDPTTGKLASETCIHTVKEVFIRGTEPLETCNDYYHSLPPEYFTTEEERLRDSNPDTIVEAPSIYVNSEIQRFQDQPAYLALRPKPVRFVFTNENTSQSETGGQENHE